MSLVDSWMEACPEGEFEGVLDRFGKPLTLKRIFDLHASLAPSHYLFDLVWTHSKIVAAIAFSFSQKAEFEGQGRFVRLKAGLAVAGALVHDVGAYRASRDGFSFDDSYIFHGLYGYLELCKAGFGQEVALFAKNHTGSGISRQEAEAENLPLPPIDYLPQTAEQKAVAYADCFHTKSAPPAFVSFEEAQRRIGRFGNGPSDRFKEMEAMFGRANVEALSQECGMPILDPRQRSFDR